MPSCLYLTGDNWDAVGSGSQGFASFSVSRGGSGDRSSLTTRGTHPRPWRPLCLARTPNPHAHASETCPFAVQERESLVSRSLHSAAESPLNAPLSQPFPDGVFRSLYSSLLKASTPTEYTENTESQRHRHQLNRSGNPALTRHFCYRARVVASLKMLPNV